MYLPHDSNHDRAMEIFKILKHTEQNLVTTSWVIAETATVLSNRDGQDNARAFLSMIFETHFDSIHISENLQSDATKVFVEQQKKRTSMVDCSNTVVLKQFGIPKIFAFDEFYKGFPVERLA